MEILNIIAPLLGVLLGSVLTGAGSMIRQRAEKKKAISVALADLLEIRHQLSATEKVLKHLRARFQVPREFIPELSHFMGSMAQGGESLDRRYEETVSLVSSFDPVLGFKLRHKNSVPALISTLRNKAIQGGVDLIAFAECESLLRKAMLPQLEKAIAELGRQHSLKTARDVRALLANDAMADPEVINLFEQLEKYVVKPQAQEISTH